MHVCKCLRRLEQNIETHTHTYNYLFVPIRGLVNLLNPSDMFLSVLQISEAHLHPSGFF